MKWKSAADIQFVKGKNKWGENVITEKIPEVVEKILKFATEYKNLKYHNKNKKCKRRCPTPELNHEGIEGL